MNKPKAKAPEKAVVTNKALESALSKKSPQGSAKDGNQAATLAAWKEEIATLMGQDFTNIDEAMAAVVSGVGDRLGASAEEREFLTTLLTTDPTIAAELRRSLRIKES